MDKENMNTLILKIKNNNNSTEQLRGRNNKGDKNLCFVAFCYGLT